MSGFTTFNAAGSGAVGVTGNVLFSYDPLYTASVPTQNIPGGTTAVQYLPGSYQILSTTQLQVTNPQIPNAALNFPFSEDQGRRITSLNGSGDFTVELWWYPTDASSFGGLLTATLNNSESTAWSLVYAGGGVPQSVGWWYNGNYVAFSTGSARCAVNAWNHLAVCRSGTTTRIFINGVLAGFNSSDTNNYRNDLNQLYINRWGNLATGTVGLMSQPRITLSAVYTTSSTTIGTAVFTPNPVLGVLPATTFYAPAPTAATATSDFSPSGQTISAVSGSVTYTATAPAASTGSGMFILDTTSGITANSAAFNFGTGPFTVEYWINTPYVANSTVAQFMTVCNMQDFTNLPGFAGGSGYAVNTLSPPTNLLQNTAFLLSPNSWNHLAFSRNSSNQLTAWVNGRPVATGSNTASYSGNLNFNRGAAPGSNVAVGPIRISNTAVYTANTAFSPPTSFSNTANTIFLLQGGSNLSTYLTDLSVNSIPVNVVGNVVSTINRVDYNISGNVIGDVSGSQNTGLTLKLSGTGTVIPTTFQNNRGGFWQFTGATGNAVIQTTAVANSAANCSLSTWIQTSTANVILGAFESLRVPTIGGDSQNVLLLNSTGNLVVFTFGGSGASTITATGNVADGRWHHVVNAMNPSTGAVSLYVDGQLVRSGSIGPGTTFTGSWKIGGGYYSGGVPGALANLYTGNLGPTAVYNSILTADQVASIYTSQLPRFQSPITTVTTGSVTLSSIGTVQTFVVPTGVTSLRVTAVGGAGAGSTAGDTNQPGGSGANIAANVAVVPGQTLFAVVGRGGLVANTTTQPLAFGGGGGGGVAGSATGSPAGSQGGGFTGLFTNNPTTQPSNLQAAGTAILIAGGGGGTAGAGGTLFSNGGNAAISLTGNATSGNSYAVGFTAVGIVSASSTGNSIVVTMSALGNTSATNFSIGSPVGFSGIGNITASNVYYVSAANNSSITAIAAPGSFGFPPAGNLTLSTARVWAGNTSRPNNQYGGGGGAWWSFGNAYPGWQGLIGGDQDSRATVYPSATQIPPTPGSVLQGGSGSFVGSYYGGGGGGGGYYGGGGGIAGTSGGGGGSNYGNLQLVGNIAYGTLNAGTTGAGANGSMTISWSSQNSANYTYAGTFENGVNNEPQVFRVPQGVSQITARVVGAAGGRGPAGGAGGAGSNISANLAVIPGQNLYLIVGRGGNVAQGGTDWTAGTLAQGGGGAAGTFAGNTFSGGGGGGFSGIFREYPSNVQVAINSAMLIAGGGGGGGGSQSFVNGSNAAISLTGQASQGSSGSAGLYFMTTGWSSTGTQIVGNITQINGVNLTQVAPANYFSTGAAVQLSGVGNVLSGQYITVASASGNLVFFNNGNASPFPAAGTTGGNTAFTLFNFINPWVTGNTTGGAGVGGGNSVTTGGAGGLLVNSLNSAVGSVQSVPGAGSALQGGGGSNSVNSQWSGGGGGGGGWFGGGGGAGVLGTGGSGGGGGSNYVSPAILGGVTYGTQTLAATSGVPLHGNINLSWANSATYTYNFGVAQTFTVPNYVTRLNVTVVGAGGAGSNNSVGGAGANLSATLNVTPGQTLFLVTGQGGRITSASTGNIATGNITSGGGGGSWRPVTTVPGGTGGGFSGIFTSNPTNVSIAQSSAVLIAGGGGAAAWNTFEQTANYFGGNASTTISANASPGSTGTANPALSNFLQSVTNVVVTSSTSATINLNTSQTNKINYTVGTPISVLGGTFPTSPYFITAVANSTVTITTGPNDLPAVGTYTGTQACPGGFNGTAVARFNLGGGGGTPSNGGYQATMFDYGGAAGFLAPVGGSAFAGGAGGYNPTDATYAQGAGGGGGWFGGGGGTQAGGVAAGGGGGSNYANTFMVANLSYGAQTVTPINGTGTDGRITITW